MAGLRPGFWSPFRAAVLTAKSWARLDNEARQRLITNTRKLSGVGTVAAVVDWAAIHILPLL